MVDGERRRWTLQDRIKGLECGIATGIICDAFGLHIMSRGILIPVQDYVGEIMVELMAISLVPAIIGICWFISPSQILDEV